MTFLFLFSLLFLDASTSGKLVAHGHLHRFIFFQFQHYIKNTDSIQQNKVVFQSTHVDNTKSIVIMNKHEEVHFFDNDDLFFEIVSPKEVSYTYRMRMAKSIGSAFSNSFKAKKLFASNPITGCDEILNSKDLKGSVALLQRG